MFITFSNRILYHILSLYPNISVLMSSKSRSHARDRAFVEDPLVAPAKGRFIELLAKEMWNMWNDDE